MRPVECPAARLYVLTVMEDRYELRVNDDLPSLRMFVYGRRPTFTATGQVVPEVIYRVEKTLGYDSAGDPLVPRLFRP